MPADFVEKLAVMVKHLGTLHWPTLGLAATSLAIIGFWPKQYARRLPGSIVALAFGTALVRLFQLDREWGLETIGSALFGGMPATGAIARTATNVKSGVRTPVAGIVHAVTLLLVVLVAAPLAKYIPGHPERRPRDRGLQHGQGAGHGCDRAERAGGAP